MGAVVAFIDITDRRLADAALANVSRKLIEAQEQERARIGRELHDDVGQRLALLAAEFQQLQENPFILPGVPAAVWVSREADFGDSLRYSIVVAARCTRQKCDISVSSAQ